MKSLKVEKRVEEENTQFVKELKSRSILFPAWVYPELEGSVIV